MFDPPFKRFDPQAINEKTDLLQLIESELGEGERRSGWRFWHCPFHTDRTASLGLNPDNTFWKCFGCNKHGDAIRWVQEKYGKSFEEACEYLNGAETAPLEPVKLVKTIRYEDGPPSDRWQLRAREFIDYAEGCLWKTPQAQAFFQNSRCLSEDTIQRFRLGYNPQDLWDQPDKWGFAEAGAKKVFIPQGHVISCQVGATLWYVKVRTCQAESRYHHIRGGRPALFNGDDLPGSPLVLLTEGELDCILAWQHLHDVTGVATLGSCSQKLDMLRWGKHLAQAQHILIAYDSDEPGRKGAARLACQLARVYPLYVPVLRPGDKDVTDYVRASDDLWDWFKGQLDRLAI